MGCRLRILRPGALEIALVIECIALVVEDLRDQTVVAQPASEGYVRPAACPPLRRDPPRSARCLYDERSLGNHEPRSPISLKIFTARLALESTAAPYRP